MTYTKFCQTPRGLRPVITFVGCCNSGKSSLINALTKQNVSIVSEFSGTTTDAVMKAFELVPFGPVILYDTAGLDDTSPLGEKRIKATMKFLEKSNLVVLVCAEKGISQTDKNAIKFLQQKKKNFIVVFNKNDSINFSQKDILFCEKNNIPFIKLSAKQDVSLLYQFLGDYIKPEPSSLFKTYLNKGDIVVLVAPIDGSAPKGRLILPQVQAIREILDAHATAFITQPSELKNLLKSLSKKPRLIVSDSQALKQVAQNVSAIPLTTFSVLMASLKGDLTVFNKGAEQLDKLQDGDKVLICESCSHKICSDDIAQVKLPKAILKYTNHKIIFEYTHGSDFPDNPAKYKLLIHCGACMFNREEMMSRIQKCLKANVAITNFGLVISKLNHIHLTDIK